MFSFGRISRRFRNLSISGDSYGCLSGYRGKKNHVIWLPNINTKFKKNSSINLQFTEYDNKTATLNDKAGHHGNGHTIAVDYLGWLNLGDVGWAPSGSPKHEGKNWLKDFQKLHVSDWWYYTQTIGVVESYRSFAGHKYFLERMGPAFQVGFGAAGWLEVCKSNEQGD